MAILESTLTYIQFSNADIPLTRGYDEGTRGLNVDLATGDAGRHITLHNGVWVNGWYHMYVDTDGLEENTTSPISSQNDDVSQYVAPADYPVTSLQELIDLFTDGLLRLGDSYILNNEFVKVAYVSPDGKYWAEQMNSSGQLTHIKIE